ncbi:MAG: glycosyltransferase family 9 protein [Bacteroidales bacterium]|nr:glycosyltransferase family 9 protein [Bacteroidales bacterium]
MIPERIIISRTDSIGDVILTLPMATLLKQLLPGCTVIFLGSSYTKDIVACCPDVDEFYDWKTADLADIKADTIIHVLPRPELAKAARRAKIQNRVGTTNRLYHWWTCNWLIKLSRKNSDLHEAQLNLKLLGFMEGVKKEYSLQEVVGLMNFKSAKASCDAVQYIDNQKFNLILHPKSKGSAREWGLDNFKRLIEILPADSFKIFICGTENEGAMVRDALLSTPRENTVDLTGKLSLADYIAFIDHCDGLVAASTGPLHIAAALGKHALGLYPPIRPMHPGRWACIGKNAKVFVTDRQCDECRKTQDCRCMRMIEPEMLKSYLVNLKK